MGAADHNEHLLLKTAGTYREAKAVVAPGPHAVYLTYTVDGLAMTLAVEPESAARLGQAIIDAALTAIAVAPTDEQVP
jgi:hypothetical protein